MERERVSGGTGGGEGEWRDWRRRGREVEGQVKKEVGEETGGGRGRKWRDRKWKERR